MDHEVLMRHPDHGCRHVYTEQEMEEWTKKGWSIDVPADEPQVGEATQERRRPGRPRKVAE